MSDVVMATAPRKSWSEWFHAFLEADAALYLEQHGAGGGHDTDGSDLLNAADDDDWYNAGSTPGGDYDELEFDEDGLIESLLIIGAAALLMILVVYRRRRQEERERERLGLPAGAPVPGAVVGGVDGGLFPGRGDDEFGNWVAGGVGH
jgi:SEL1 protein